VLCWDSKRFRVVAAQARVAIDMIKAMARRARSGRCSWEEGLRNIFSGFALLSLSFASDRCWEGCETKEYTIDIYLYSSRDPRSNNKAFENRKRKKWTAGRSYGHVQWPISTSPTLHKNHASRADHTAPTHNTLESALHHPPQRLFPSRPAESAMALN
jgi:hypothetical protein